MATEANIRNNDEVCKYDAVVNEASDVMDSNVQGDVEVFPSNPHLASLGTVANPVGPLRSSQRTRKPNMRYTGNDWIT